MFTDVYYQPGESPVFCYRSGQAVYEEVLDHGVLAACGYNASGYPLNVLSNYPSRLDYRKMSEPSAFLLEADGQSLTYGLEMEDFQVSDHENVRQAVLTLRSSLLPLRIRVCTVLDGTQMFERWLVLENLSDHPVRLSHLAPMAGGLETMDRQALSETAGPTDLYTAGYFTEDVWSREGHFDWQKLQPGVMAVDCRFGRDRFRHPMMLIRNHLKGTLLFFQTAFSGGCRFTLDLNARRETTASTLAFAAEITGYAPLLVLDPHESFETPHVHAGILAGDLDDCVQEMHRHARQSVLNLPEAAPDACLIGAGMGAEHDMSVETSKAFIRQFAQMGAEVFIIDAGWECPPAHPIDWVGFNGMNEPNAARYPKGLSEVSDYCHKQGLKFGMWIEIERMGKKSRIWDAHPEWRSSNRFGEPSEGYIDLTIPEAASWAEEELARMIDEYQLDLLRIDYNVSAQDYFAMRDRGSGIPECISLRQFDAVCKMYTRLKKRFPSVIFENCAGGGARTDWGMMKAFHHTWVSDCQKAPHSLLITNGMTMALPPERVDRLFAGMGCHEFGSLALQLRNTMLTHMSLNVISPVTAPLHPDEIAFIRRETDLYKSFIRPFLPHARVYHHTPDAALIETEKRIILEMAADDASRGVLGIFSMPGYSAKAPVSSENVIPRGIKPSARYRITLDNTGCSYEAAGHELLQQGISFRLPGALQSELILYEMITTA